MKSYPFFNGSELRCKCGECDGGEMGDSFMIKLVHIRSLLGLPINLSSAYRCPEYNDKVSHTGLHGPHTTGKAVDILCNGEEAFLILRLATEQGMTGIGVSQKGPHPRRFLHIDTIAGKLRPWVWSY